VKLLLKRIKMIVNIGLVAVLLLSACESLPFEIPWLVNDVPTPTKASEEVGEATPTPDTTPAVEETPQPVTRLTIWVPPEMDPELETEASVLFANRLKAFSEANDGIEISVRIKASSGVGGLLDALTASSSAAPGTLPDIIALSRTDMETAALKGLITALDGMTDIPDDPDWFSFSREMALIQGSTFGLPFTGDALALVYRPEAIPEFPTTWSGIYEEDLVLAFPTEHDQSLYPMALYLAEGGALQDPQRRPMLEVDPLAEGFRLFEVCVESGTFPEWLNQYQTFGQVWTAFRDGQVDLAVAWVSNFLQERPEDALMMPLIPGSEGAVSLGTGMSWAVATPETHRHPMAVALAEFLVAPEYLASWSLAAGYIPPRPSALEGWQNQMIRTTISQIALMTHLRPSNDVVLILGPVMRDGTRQIMQDLVDPAQAAQMAVESLGDS
jgi:ABC-type glycerol-3-phosphate transport system substrate-binding protein